MGVISGGKVIEGAASRSLDRTAIFEYVFGTDGGAVGTISLRPVTSSQPQIPSGAIVTSTLIEVLTVPTSGGAATVSMGIEAAGDVVTAAAISGAPWSSLGRKAGTPVSAATSLKTTAARTPSIVVAVAALTAGSIRLYVNYLDPAV